MTDEQTSARETRGSRSSRPSPSSPPRTWAQRWRRTVELRRRVALSAAAGSVSGIVLALADASWAVRGRDGSDVLQLIIGTAGAMAPLALVVGAFVGIGSWIMHPRVEPSVGRLIFRLRDAGAGRPADIAAFVPLCSLGLFLWTTLSAQLARLLLGTTGQSLLVGAAIGTGATALGLVVALVVLALTPALRQRLAIWRSSWDGWVDPAATLAIAMGVTAALVAFGTWRGTVSGEGGLLGIYGILKRPELDLRAPGAMAFLLITVYLAPSLLSWLRSPLAVLIALAPLAVTARAARSLDAHPEIARLIERSAPVSAKPLALLRKLTDRDRDGASRWFGDGDCNDANPRIGPAAEDVPDNGVDEDCSGSDLTLAGSAPPPPLPPPPIARERIPKDGNVVLVTIDTLRYDLGFAGYPRPVSPNLDALAKRSTVFERAYALASFTGRAIGPMLIGKYCSEARRQWGHFTQFAPEEIFVTERIKSAGIRTISVQGHHYFGAFGGLDSGFDVVDLGAAPPKTASWAIDSGSNSDKLTDAAIKHLTEVPSGQRFFLWVHYLDPHADYLRHDDVPSFGGSARDLYDNEVAFTDKHVGRLFDFIAKQSWADRTSVIVTSDHGEAFGEHKMWRHGVELWEPLVRVPLIVHVPGNEPTRIGVRRSHIDIAPTIIELFALPMPTPREAAPEDSVDFVSGVSLLPDVVSPPPSPPPAARDIVIDMPAGPYNESRRAFIHGDLKLIVSRDAAKELFDLAKDPDETRDVWRDRRSEIEAAYAQAKARMRIIEVKGAAGN
jgi:arylsulfatase A-like enzyme